MTFLASCRLSRDLQFDLVVALCCFHMYIFGENGGLLKTVEHIVASNWIDQQSNIIKHPSQHPTMASTEATIVVSGGFTCESCCLTSRSTMLC